jgi:hypothetical protein
MSANSPKDEIPGTQNSRVQTPQMSVGEMNHMNKTQTSSFGKKDRLQKEPLNEEEQIDMASSNTAKLNQRKKS